MQALKCRLSLRRQIVELSVWDRASACVSGVGHWKWLWLMAGQSRAARVPFPLREQFRGWCVQSDTRALPNYQWGGFKGSLPRCSMRKPYEAWMRKQKHFTQTHKQMSIYQAGMFWVVAKSKKIYTYVYNK